MIPFQSIRLALAVTASIVAAVAGVQAGDTAVANPINQPIELGTLNLGGLVGVESLVSDTWGGRFYVGFPVTDYLYASPLSIALARSDGDKAIRVSANGLLTAISMLGLGTESILILAIAPQMFLNPTLDLPVAGGRTFSLSAVASVRTDWYAFSEGSRLQMEASPGLRLRMGKVVVEGRYVWPFIKGYRDSRDPIVGINLYFGGRR